MTKRIVYTLPSLCKILLLGGTLNASCNNSKSVHMKSAASSSISPTTESIPTKSHVPNEIWRDIFSCLDSEVLHNCKAISKKLKAIIGPYSKQRFYPIHTRFEEVQRSSVMIDRLYYEWKREIDAEFENQLARAQQESPPYIDFKGADYHVPQLVKAIDSLKALRVRLVGPRDRSETSNRIKLIAEALNEKPKVSRLDLNLFLSRPYLSLDEAAEALSLSKLQHLTYLFVEDVDHNQMIGAIASLTGLRHLCIKKHGEITSQELQALSKLENLVELDISNKYAGCPMCLNQVGSEAHCTFYTTFNHTFNSQAIRSLFNLKNLKALYITQAQFDESGRKIIAALQDQRPDLSIKWCV